jgi:hypothetical protein
VTQNATARLRDALGRGEALTRLEACERFGMTGATFRWAIQSFMHDGDRLEFELVEGRRGTSAKRWRLAPAERSGTTRHSRRG